MASASLSGRFTPYALIEAQNWIELTHGWAATAAFLQDGRRQILHFHLPGDWLAPTSRLFCGCHYIALTPVNYHSAKEAANDATFSTAARNADQLQSLVLYYQTIRLGAFSAYQRISHLLLEFHARSLAAGLSVGDTFPMPLTEQTLSEGLGLSVVHVNRSLQQLRRDQMVKVERGRVDILNRADLTVATEFQWPDLFGDPKGYDGTHSLERGSFQVHMNPAGVDTKFGQPPGP